MVHVTASGPVRSALKARKIRACTRIGKTGAAPLPGENPLDPEYRRLLFAARKSFTVDQERAILAACADSPPDTAALCRLLYVTGCRLSEALQLRLNCLDTEQHLVVLHTLKQRRQTSIRAVPVPPALITEFLALPRAADGRFWRFSRWTARRRLAELFDQANITGPLANSRTFRHSFNDRGKLAGVPDHVRCALLGHRSQSSNDLYGALVTPDLHAQARACWGQLHT